MYSDELSNMLSNAGAEEGAVLTVVSGGRSYEGMLMPHSVFNDPNVIVLKVSSGYNIGIEVHSGDEITVLKGPVEKETVEAVAEPRPGLKHIALIGTGGTIASYVDYRTGAVHPALSTSDMVNAVPEIREVANITATVLFSIFSENMTVEHWQKLADEVALQLNNGADAVIIPHGTDTMGYTAAALSFMLGGVQKPVILVGAQRSSDRPSSDASSNLMAAARFCVNGNRAGVFVIMHDTPGDDSFAVHNGARVRKMHTSRRDAFHSINVPPVAHLDRNGIIKYFADGKPVGNGKVVSKSNMDKSVVLLQYYPGMDPDVFSSIFKNSHGIVIAGSGLGHVNSNMVPLIKEANNRGAVVVITSQCLGGRTNLNVYDTGRDMIAAGAITVKDMLLKK